MEVWWEIGQHGVDDEVVDLVEAEELIKQTNREVREK